MDVVGSEIGQKMRSAIKAKLTELGCYVDDELPDYVMVMVANKRTRSQMEDDLQLFLGDNTELFVNWLHQVLKKLQEVTITTPKLSEAERSKEKKSKEKKSKKADSEKKAKKKDKVKEKSLRKKEKQDKKLHKNKKKDKHDKHEMIRPNIPPLLMNMEKESEPSITDVFAGQILKNHGVIVEPSKQEAMEIKTCITEAKRNILPIIDPSTITSESETTESTVTQNPIPTEEREEQIKEINEIEAKIQGLKQKLAEQLDSMSEDEDFLNIRTEAEELMNDFAEDVFQEISQPPPFTPPTQASKPVSQSPTLTEEPAKDTPKEAPKLLEELPHIELRLPKRPVRERLGVKQGREPEKSREKTISPERFTPEREPEFRPQTKSAKSRLGQHAESNRKVSHSDETPATSKKVTSRVSVLENRPSRSTCASVVRVRPRPRVAPSSSLLLKAMADAHKSLFNIPPKIDNEQSKIKRAMVLPMRRTIEATNIVIQVPGETVRRDPDILSLGDEQDDDKFSKSASEDLDKDEYIPSPITKVITNTDYVPSNARPRTTRIDDDDKLIVETINIHNTKKDKDKDTQFIVTMDGFNPNAFLAKKLMTEGLLDDDTIIDKPKTKTDSVLRIKDPEVGTNKESNNEKVTEETAEVETTKNAEKLVPHKKRVSDTSEDSDTQVIIIKEDITARKIEEKKTDIDTTKITEKRKSLDADKIEYDEPKAKKRRASPIVFDVVKPDVKEVKERVRERTESASSDTHVTVPTTLNSNKYDSLPPLNTAAAAITSQPTKPWCRSFPSCRFGSACAFAHPKCKFATSCTRRGCVYSHPTTKLQPVVASHVVPAANFKSISAATLPSVCKFFPNCVNPACHFYHPKPCRYGKQCLNKIECNFYHTDTPNSAFRYPV